MHKSIKKDIQNFWPVARVNRRRGRNRAAFVRSWRCRHSWGVLHRELFRCSGEIERVNERKTHLWPARVLIYDWNCRIIRTHDWYLYYLNSLSSEWRNSYEFFFLLNWIIEVATVDFRRKHLSWNKIPIFKIFIYVFNSTWRIELTLYD